MQLHRLHQVNADEEKLWGRGQCNGTRRFELHFLLQTSMVSNKGDFLLISDHLIELVTRLHQAVLETTKEKLKLQVTDE